jgi:hypothetical protein
VTAKPDIVSAVEQPFAIEVMVYEEDTYRVLSAGNHIREIREPLHELGQEATGQLAHQTGDLVTVGSRWFAIVHDFDNDKSYQSESVDMVLSRMADEIKENDIRTIGLQALGSFHGPETIESAVARVLSHPWPKCLTKIWLVVPDKE